MARPEKTMLIACNLKLTRVKDYSSLFIFMEQLSPALFKEIKNLYIIKTTASAETIKDALRYHTSPIDSLLVIELPEEFEYAFHGFDEESAHLLETLL